MAETEIESVLRAADSVVLDANGLGTLTFEPDHANQRWVVTQVVVRTNQPATATTIPVATLARNAATLATMSASSQEGASWAGNQDTFTGETDVGSCDSLSVFFSPPAGQSGAPLAGFVASANLRGTKYTRRGATS